MASTELHDALARLLPADAIVEMRYRYAVDGVWPQLAVAPRSIEDVSAVLRYASDSGLAVIPVGAGIALDLGNRPSSYDLTLDLSRFDELVEYSPEDLVVTVQAGMTIGALNQRLAERGQFLALDTPLAERATVGGAISANLTGPTRLRYGTARDLVIGLTCVLSGGEIVHSGGRVVKNVAGYDLNKLYAGALGGLGIILEASLKLHPLPVSRAALCATYPSFSAVHAASLALVNSSLSPTAVEIAGFAATPDLAAVAGLSVGDGSWLLATFMSGLSAAVERQRMETERIARESGATGVIQIAESRREPLLRRLRDFGRHAADPAVLILRCSVLPSELTAAFDGLAKAIDISTAASTTSPGSGTLRLAWIALPADPSEIIARARDALNAIGGSVIVERCPSELKQAIDVWGIDGPDLELMRAMKAAYDPANTLSPGRFVGRL